MMVAGRWPERKAAICWTSSPALRPLRRGIALWTSAWAAWQPEHDEAPSGASADPAGEIGNAVTASAATIAAGATKMRFAFMSNAHKKGRGGPSVLGPPLRRASSRPDIMLRQRERAVAFPGRREDRIEHR